MSEMFVRSHGRLPKKDGEEVIQAERAVIQSLFNALSSVVTRECPVKVNCIMCGVRATCKKSGKLYREIETLLKQDADLKVGETQ